MNKEYKRSYVPIRATNFGLVPALSGWKFPIPHFALRIPHATLPWIPRMP